MAYFLSRLIPPRSTFTADMSAEEGALMLAHQDYWLPQVNAGLVLAMGLVLDPKAAFGAMIANAPSLERLEALQTDDPLVRAGRGFVFENFPMASVSVAPQEPLAPVSSISP